MSESLGNWLLEEMRWPGSWQNLLTFPVSRIFSRKSTPEDCCSKSLETCYWGEVRFSGSLLLEEMWRLGSWQLLSTFPVSRIYYRKSTLDKSHCLSGQNLAKKGKHKFLPRKHHCLGSWIREKMRECQFLGKIRETQVFTEKLTTDDTGSNWHSRVLDARHLGSWLKLLTFPESRIFSRNQFPRHFLYESWEFARELITGGSR